MAKQFVVQLKNDPGAMATLAEALAARGVDLRAIGGGGIGDSGHMIMTTADDDGTQGGPRRGRLHLHRGRVDPGRGRRPAGRDGPRWRGPGRRQRQHLRPPLPRPLGRSRHVRVRRRRCGEGPPDPRALKTTTKNDHRTDRLQELMAGVSLPVNVFCWLGWKQPRSTRPGMRRLGAVAEARPRPRHGAPRRAQRAQRAVPAEAPSATTTRTSASSAAPSSSRAGSVASRPASACWRAARSDGGGDVGAVRAQAVVAVLERGLVGEAGPRGAPRTASRRSGRR